jgi:predicted peroxiredoxin
MLDTDQVYPRDTLTKLLSHEVDIAGVLVHKRWAPFNPVMLRGTLGKYIIVEDEEMYSGDLVEVDATGTGCLLFDMRVFDKVKYPWFKFSVINEKPVGEDIYFCSKARQSGVRIFVDTSIEVGHLTTMEVNKTLHLIATNLTKNGG